jgi:hypothetical protein
MVACIEAGAVIDIDIIDADGGLLELDLARARIADLEFNEVENFGTAELVDLDGCGHGNGLALDVDELLVGVCVF